MQRAQLSVGPAAARGRASPAHMLQVHTRTPSAAAPPPNLRARREARQPPRDTTCARHRHVLARLQQKRRRAPPVLLTACALLPRCRQSQLRAVGLDGHRALDIYTTTGRRDVDTTVTMIRPPSRQRSPAWPRRREACACEACACEPGAVVLEGAAPSAHCLARSPSSTAPSTPSWSSAP
jgi:hypothetical protein